VATIHRWPLRVRLGQLIMVDVEPGGVAGARAAVRDQGVGGVFVGGNTTTLFTSGALRSLAGPGQIPPMVAVDEEGGRVQRIDGLDGPVPSARVMARTMTVEEVRALARTRGAALRRYGVTVDFAPVVDVSRQADREVIGDRSFSDDPAVVIAYARAFAAGLRDAGVLPVFKHFPGHGHAVGDSHQGISTTPPFSALGPDLAPYRALLPEGGAAVMVGHLDVPGLTGGVPASLSPAAVDGLLRRDMGFDGLVFTDELGGMRAITDRYGIAESTRRALAAGADVALFAQAGSVPAVLDRLVADVGAGRLSEAGVDRSVHRVLVAKGVDPCRPAAG
jgi:beta-N-acetylhexosaminidase